MMQFFLLLISLVTTCFIGALSLYCFAYAAVRVGGNLPGELKWILEKAASLDAFIIFLVTTFIISNSLAGSTNRISNHIILSLDILFFFNSLILIFFHTIKQTRFALGK